MRPVKLSLSAFGPYAGDQVVDFGALKDRTLFIIHGRTGSGKTSILDAISFALYGVCSGKHREIKQIRSDHAAPTSVTEVTFEFTISDKKYRVYRKPEQPRPKKGGGFVSAKPEAALQIYDGTDETNGDKWTTLATKWNAVTQEIESLIGFRAEQFRQVVMLPQGEFLKLLHADSKERQNILEVLFQTEFYRLVEEELKLEAKKAESQVETLKDHLKVILNQAGVESKDDLQSIKMGEEEKLLTVKEKVAELREVDQRAQTALEQGQLIHSKFAELEQAQRALQKLLGDLDKIAGKRKDLEAARKAQALAPFEKSRNDRKQESDRAGKKLDEAKTAFGKANEDLRRAEPEYLEKKKQFDSLDIQKQELNAINIVIQKLKLHEESKSKISEARKESDLKETALNELKSKLQDSRKKLEQSAVAREEASQKAVRVDSLETQIKDLEKQAGLHRELSKIRRNVSIALRKSNELTKGFEQSLGALAEALEEYKAFESAWFLGQAAILAKELKPGTPCPVCGSSTHPGPAVSTDPLPDAESIKTKSEAVEKLRLESDKLRDQKTKAESELSTLQTKEELIQADLLQETDLNPNKITGLLQSLKDELRASLEAKSKIPVIERQADAVRRAITEFEKKLLMAEEERTQALTALQHAEGAAAAIAADIPAGVESVDQAEKTRISAQRRIRSIETAYETAQKTLETARQSVAACKAALEAAGDNSALAAQSLLVARQEFEHELSKTGFADESDYLSAKRTPAEIQALDQEISKFDLALGSAKDRLARAEASAKDLEKPDIAALKSAALEAKKSLEAAIRQEAAISEKIKSVEAWLQDYSRNAEKLEELEAATYVIRSISDTANGQNYYRVTFQRFVLATLLDDVLTAAGARLQIMTNGRFWLRRSREVIDRRSLAGLDLEVHDTYTGTERPVRTLSGGESFLASLSLALGLADVVQAHAGGIRLETIFVDEGFGSLDPETLDLAMKALIDLQKNGRLVGIISHIGELRERIDARLEVTKSRDGSAATFSIG
jgi:DNA repair protein SbcC/Rad50